VNINLDKPKKDDLLHPSPVSTAPATSARPRFADPSLLLEKLKGKGVSAAVLTITEPQKPLCLDLPPPLTDLFNEQYHAKSPSELRSAVADVFETLTITAKEASAVETMTRKQSNSAVWVEQRRGRLTSSIFGEIYKTSLEVPSKSLLKKILGLNNVPNTPAIKWGRQNEKVALSEYEKLMKASHVNFHIRSSGLIIHPQHPFIASSPDSEVSCDCHGVGLVEVKCPYSQQNLHPCRIDNAYLTPHECQSPLCPRILDQNHNYFYQVQGQLNVHASASYCHFVCWTPLGLHVECINKDTSFFACVLDKLKTYFYDIVLPELMTHSITCAIADDADEQPPTDCTSPADPVPDLVADSSSSTSSSGICICASVKNEKVIVCANESCEIKFYHVSCMGFKKGPRGSWTCKTCKKIGKTRSKKK
jgi:hypothetical protein